MVDLMLGLDGDLVLEGGDLVVDQGLGTAVLASIFTDGRASAEVAAQAGSRDLRGWWPDTDGDRWGSLLWTLARAKASRETLLQAQEAVRTALEWLIEEGAAESVDVTASYAAGGVLVLSVVIRRGSDRRWSHLWEAPGPVQHEVGGARVLLTWEGGGLPWS